MTVKHRFYKLSELSIDFINNLPKVIDENGCWIPPNVPNSAGYVQIMIEYQKLFLHRISMCIHNNIDYYNYKYETRHNTGCDRKCFNPEHLKPGSCSDNIKDSVKDKTHKESRKTHCFRCGGPYKSVTNKHGAGKGKTQRYCPKCSLNRQRMRKVKS